MTIKENPQRKAIRKRIADDKNQLWTICTHLSINELVSFETPMEFLWCDPFLNFVLFDSVWVFPPLLLLLLLFLLLLFALRDLVHEGGVEGSAVESPTPESNRNVPMDGGMVLRRSRRRTTGPPFLISSMASAWVMFLVLMPLISISWSPTRSRPSWAADPLSAIRRTNKGIWWNSLPPRMLKPNPRVPRLNSTA